MVTATDFMIRIIKGILNLPMVGDIYLTYGVSRNIFARYNNKDEKLSTIGKTAAIVLKRVILNEISKDKDKEIRIYNYMDNFLSKKEKGKYENNIDAKVSIAISKFVPEELKVFKIVDNFAETDNKNNKKELYAKEIKILFGKAFDFIKSDDIFTAILYSEKILYEIISTIINLENLIIKDTDFIEKICSHSIDIIPENIVISFNNLNIITDTKLTDFDITDDFREMVYLNLKIVTKWYLNHYLESTIHRIPDDTKKLEKNNGLQIVTLTELLDNGWTLESYMIECSNMWDNTMENKMTDEHKGGIEQWIQIVKEHPDNSRILLNDKDEMVGFWDFVTLFEDEYKKAKAGQLNDCELTVEIMPPMIPGTYNIYFASICLKENYKKTLALQKLLISMLNVFEELALNGVFIDEICTWAYTDSGIALSKALGLKYHVEHKEHGKIFYTTMIDLLKQPLSKKFKTLKVMYNQYFKI